MNKGLTIILTLVATFFCICAALSFFGWLIVSSASENAVHEVEALILLVAFGIFSGNVLLVIGVAQLMSRQK